jgi:phosphoglycolate phosphatase
VRLVLWDIDHTLIDTGGVGSEVFSSAFEMITGKPLGEMPDPTGLTEQAIFEKACQSSGVEKADALFEDFAEAQAAEYQRRARELHDRGRILPGVLDVLVDLGHRDDVVSTVLSGNPRAAGSAKLEAFGLHRYLDLEVSAGGDDDAHRPALVPIVWRRAQEKHGVSFGPHNTVVVGDSPADIATAQANRCRVIAVATGKTSALDLAREHPDVVLPDLADTESLLEDLLA